MGIVYDPMTGEPIETPDEEVNSEVNESSEGAEAVETVEEVAAEAVETAEEAVPEAVEATEEVVTEAANTVETFNQEISEGSNAESVVDNFANGAGVKYEAPGVEAYEEPKPEKKLNKTVLYIAIGAVAALIIIVACFLGGVFSSKKAKVAAAFANTFNVDSKLLSDMKTTSDILNNKEYSMGFKVEMEDAGSIEGNLALSEDKKQLYVDTNLDDIVPFSALLMYDENTISAEVPKACDYLFEYNYREDKDGYLVDLVGKDDIKEIDGLLQVIYDNSSKNNNEYFKELNDLYLKYIKELEFKDAGKETFKVDGEKVECKGISVLIENDMMVDFFDEFYDLYMEQLEESFENVPDIADMSSIKKELKDAKKSVKKLPDTEITFYIYKKALACIHIDTGKKKDNVDILFKGGDFRAQNIVIENRDGEILSFKMTMKKDKETYKVTVDNNEYEIVYNTKNGDVELSYDSGRTSDEIEFNVQVKNNEVTVTLEDFEIPFLSSMNMEFKLSKGADFKKFTNSDKFDVGNADENDFEDLIEEIDEDFVDDISSIL